MLMCFPTILELKFEIVHLLVLLSTIIMIKTYYIFPFSLSYPVMSFISYKGLNTWDCCRELEYNDDTFPSVLIRSAAALDPWKRPPSFSNNSSGNMSFIVPFPVPVLADTCKVALPLLEQKFLSLSTPPTKSGPPRF